MASQPTRSDGGEVIVGHVTQAQVDKVFTKKVEQTTLKTGSRLKLLTRNNYLVGGGIVACVLGIYGYTMFAVKQGKLLEDFDKAGVCAALSSAAGKLAASAGAAGVVAGAVQAGVDLPQPAIEQLALCLRVLGLCGVFLFNALMWILFSKALQLCASTLEATAINTGANFFFTAILGAALGEHLPPIWYVGSGLIAAGLALLHRGSEKAARDADVVISDKKLKTS